jgi:hypothetical protein
MAEMGSSVEMLRMSISRLLFLKKADAPRRPERRLGLVEAIGTGSPQRGLWPGNQWIVTQC